MPTSLNVKDSKGVFFGTLVVNDPFFIASGMGLTLSPHNFFGTDVKRPILICSTLNRIPYTQFDKTHQTMFLLKSIKKSSFNLYINSSTTSSQKTMKERVQNGSPDITHMLCKHPKQVASGTGVPTVMSGKGGWLDGMRWVLVL